MRTLLLTFAVALVGGCSTAPPVAPPMPPAPPPLADGPYAGIPTRPSADVVAAAQPVAPTGDEALDAFLATLAADIDRRDWLSVAQAMDPEVFPEQRAILAANGSGDAAAAAAQLIVETLGIDGLGAMSWDALDRIQVVTFREHGVETPGVAGGEARQTVSGDVRLDDGTTLPLSFSLLSRGGVYVVEVPVG